jgi:SAM-dependent methyltransferase
VSCDFSGTGLNPDIEFIGLDHSLVMLARAKDDWVGEPISLMWIEGSAAQIPGELNGSVDLAIFAAGSMGHLLDIENDVVPFLRSMRRVLKQRGLACVSILTEFIEGEDTSEVNFGGAVELRSEDGKRTYKRRETRHEWKGNIKKEFFVVELREDGKVTWEEEIGWKLRRWKTEEWEQLLKDVGFDWMVRDVGEERWYSLRKKLYVS